MELPKLKVRPRSTQSCTEFRGILHNTAAPLGRWIEARNLTSDGYPTMIPARENVRVSNIDGNTPAAKIVAACGGRHPILLDSDGKLWCNGHFIRIGDEERWFWVFSQTAGRAVTVTISGENAMSGSTDDNTELGGLLTDEEKTVIFEFTMDGQLVIAESLWNLIDGGQSEVCATNYSRETIGGKIYHHWDFVDYGFRFTTISGAPAEGYRVTLKTWKDLFYNGSPMRLVRMGAKVILWAQEPTDSMWADAVKLENGSAMVRDTDYGFLGGSLNGEFGEDVSLTLCDIDGNDYSGVVVSNVEPFSQEGFWLDTSQSKPTLREWSYLQTAWVTVTSTFVKVGPLDHTPQGWALDVLHKGDAVQFDYSHIGLTVDQDVDELLNGSHYLYNVLESGGYYYLVVSGILNDDSKTADMTDGSLWVRREVPALDFVVECGNRLWGCRYDAANSINEIYASALGDPQNWEVFQGLSTDSWRASRGRAAPFTGAIAMDGHPLFFREESLEKVCPSSSGAHQILEYDLDGVEQGANDSLVIIDDRLYYKSRTGVMVYTGTMPAKISGDLGDMDFVGGSAGRHGKKYCLATMRRKDELKRHGAHDFDELGGNSYLTLVYDTERGDWHIQSAHWVYGGVPVTVGDRLYYASAAGTFAFENENAYGLNVWSAQTAPQQIHLPEHKWISYIRIRYRILNCGIVTDGVQAKSHMTVAISYDDGDWQTKKVVEAESSGLNTIEICVFPRRADHFRLYLSGMGPVQIYEISYRMERSEGGH